MLVHLVSSSLERPTAPSADAGDIMWGHESNFSHKVELSFKTFDVQNCWNPALKSALFCLELTSCAEVYSGKR